MLACATALKYLAKTWLDTCYPNSKTNSFNCRVSHIKSPEPRLALLHTKYGSVFNKGLQERSLCKQSLLKTFIIKKLDCTRRPHHLSHVHRCPLSGRTLWWNVETQLDFRVYRKLLVYVARLHGAEVKAIFVGEPHAKHPHSRLVAVDRCDRTDGVLICKLYALFEIHNSTSLVSETHQLISYCSRPHAP